MPNWDGKLIYWTLATVVVKGVDMACNQSQSSILLFKFQRTNGTMELIPIQYFEPIAEKMTSGGHSHSGLWTNHWADDVTYRILVCKKMDPLHCEQSLFFVRFSESSARAREGHSRETRETRAAAREKKETARKARANEICVGLTTQKYDWRMSEALTTTCQQSKMMAEALQECLSENRSIRRSYLRDRNLNTQSLYRLAPSVTRVVICVSRGFCTTD